MSWHYSQALVAAYSAANSSAGVPSAPSNGSLTHALYCAPDRMKVFSRLSRYGMTCEPLTDDLGAGVLTWCLAGSLAKTYPQPAKAQESTESAAECGRTWHESFARWDRATLSWRTPQCSLLEGLDEFSETWPQWGMMHAGECSVQSMPVHLTSEIGSGLWPTPRAGNPGSRPNGKGGKVLAEEVEIAEGMRTRGQPLWPTPTVCGNYNRKGLSATSGDGLATAVKMWPTPDTCAGGTGPSQMKRNQPRLQDAVKFATPCARDWKEQTLSMSLAKAHGNTEKSRQLPRQLSAECPELHGGQLNPTWVEWLMGWPLGWTDLKPLETDKFQAWRHSHGGF